MSNIWRLTIEKSDGKLIALCGSEEILQGEIDAWSKYEKEVAEAWAESENRGVTHRDPSDYKVRTVIGFSDDVTRTELRVAYRFIDTIGLALVQL